MDLASRAFTVLTNRAVSFPLYSSLVRTDRARRRGRARRGARRCCTRHAPLVTVLRYGKRSRQAEIPVHLSARFTELGTLELWLQSAADGPPLAPAVPAARCATATHEDLCGRRERDEALVPDEADRARGAVAGGRVRRSGAGGVDTGNGGRAHRDAPRIRQAGLAAAVLRRLADRLLRVRRMHGAGDTASRRGG